MNRIDLRNQLVEAVRVDPAYIIVGEGGDGSLYALDTSHADEAGEAPVIRISVDGHHSQQVAESFGAYLLQAVKAIV